MGIITSVASGAFPAVVPQFFTPDIALWPLMQGICPHLLLSTFFCGVDIGATGILYANQENSFVAQTMVVNLIMITGYLWVCNYMSWGLKGVWGGIVFFFFLRAVATSFKVLNKWLDPEGLDRLQT